MSKTGILVVNSDQKKLHMTIDAMKKEEGGRVTAEGLVSVRVVEGRLSEKVAFNQKPESCQRTVCAKNEVSSAPGRGNSQFKGL